MTYKTNDNAQMSMQYDNRLASANTKSLRQSRRPVVSKRRSFQYFADSSVQAMDNQVNDEFDRNIFI